ncbi:MAG: penicillin-binding protein 2 [bacterium]|nr:penicillin-binding protein 2 [bacterium]
MVQIVSGETFREKAEHQYIAGANYFDRGSIFFTTKDGVLVPAATVKVGFILAINPSILSKSADLNDIYDKINQILPLDQGEFMAKARKEGDPYEELSRRLPQEEADKIQALKIPGVSVYRERWRFYPGKELAAHAIGLMGYQGDDFGGRYGLERLYEPVLERKGDSTFVNFFAEIFSNIKRGVLDGESLEGDIITTIEPSVQSFLDGQLEKLVESYSPDFSGGIVIDPKTGEIFALSLFPQFDPNNSSKASDVGIFRNKFVEDRYEMGSIIKAIAMASALDSGAVTARTTYNDPGCMTLNNKTFCNYDGKSHGSGITMQTVLSKSLNTGMAFAAKQMGNQTFSDYMLRFGLGEKTGIDLPNEGNSLVSNLKTKRDLEMAQAAFGQGIALTPINTVRALSVLANGGKLIEPHLVKEISYEIGGSKVIEPKLGEQIISATTSEEISRMLTEVVDRSLRNGLVRLENYSVAAKTGTAQIARSGGYYDDRFLHSFFGYFPSYEPRFLVFLFTYYPKNVQYASETLTDTFINTTKFLINYYEIPPDREAPPPPRG